MLWTAAGLVLAQGVILVAAHNATVRYFAWTIAAPVTAGFLGVGYLSAAVPEAAAARQATWQRARVAVPGVLAFTTLTLVVTLVDLAKFHLLTGAAVTRALTWGWLAIFYFSRWACSALAVSRRFLRPITPIIGANGRPIPFGRISSSWSTRVASPSGVRRKRCPPSSVLM